LKRFNENYLKAACALLSMTFMVYIGTSLLSGVKLDFTEEKLYTLSSGTKSILEKLDSPVKLKLYYSKTAANKGTEGLRQFNNHYLYVKELLKEFEANSRNNISFETIDPRPDTEEEENALAYGLKKFHLTDTERYFFGLAAIGESGAEKVIEFFDPNQKNNLEYDLAKLVYSVVNPQKKTIGVISSLSVVNEELSPTVERLMRMQGKPVEGTWLSFQMLNELYNVKLVKSDTDSIPAVDALAIIHPKGFPEKTLFAIDQYLLKGGKLLVLTDPNAISDASMNAMGQVSASPDAGFKRLMDKWGLEVPENTFAGDKYLSGVGSFSPSSPPGRLLPLLSCDQRCAEEYNDPVSSGLGHTNFLYPGVIKVKEQEGVKHSPLYATTEKGNTYKGDGFELRNPSILWQRFKEGQERVVLGYKSVGSFKSAFPNSIKNKDGKKQKAIKESEKEGAIILFSDVDFIADQFAFKKTFLGPALTNDNSALLMNSVETLTGNTDLLSVRTKGRVDRGFDVVEAIEFEAEKRTADKVREINQNIAKFQRELNELGSRANGRNLALLRNEGVKKKKELAKKIALLKKDLRAVKREGREKVEELGSLFHYLNTLFAPALVIAFGVIYSNRRKKALIKSDKGAEVKHQTFKEVQA